jgi:hypothetical protein
MSLGPCSNRIGSADMRVGHVDAQTIYRVIIPQHHYQVFGDPLPRTRSQVPTWHQSPRHVPIDYIRAARRHSQKGMYQQTFMPGVHVRCLRHSCLRNDKHLKIIPGSTRPSQHGQISSDMSCNLRGDSARQGPAAQSTTIQQARSIHTASGSCSII